MKKSDLKKLALMGIAGGFVLISEANAEVAETNSFSHQLARSCGGEGGCGNLADNQRYGNQRFQYAPPSQSCAAPQAYQQSQPSHSCGAPQSYQPSHPSHSCGASQSYQPSHPSHGCAVPQSYQQSQPSHSCGASQSYQQPHYPQSQWETAYEPRSSSTQNARDQQWSSSKSQENPSSQQWSGQNQGRSGGSGSTSKYLSDASKPSTTKNLSEAELQAQLNSQGKALYQSLSPEGKALALKLANQSCKGKNECKGLNSCKNSEHSCAGKGNCAGTSPDSFKDKNTAVKVAAMKMAEKRAKMAR